MIERGGRMEVVRVDVGQVGKNLVVGRCGFVEYHVNGKVVETEGCARAAVCLPGIGRTVRRSQPPSRYGASKPRRVEL